MVAKNNGKFRKVLGIIPARGGSKGIPRKNLALLCGKPLLYYTIKAASLAKTLDRVILSTDDAEVAEAGRRYGVEVPFIRPSELAKDDTPAFDVIKHAVAFFEQKGEGYDAFCILQPTNPLRKPEYIDDCVHLLFEKGADTVITISEVSPEYNPHWVYFRRDDSTLYLSTKEDEPIPHRQSLPPAFHREGSVYVVRRDVIIKQDTLYGKKILGYLVDENSSINIDSPEDLVKAEAMLPKIAQ